MASGDSEEADALRSLLKECYEIKFPYQTIVLLRTVATQKLEFEEM